MRNFILLLGLVSFINLHAQSEWSSWKESKCFKGIDFRTKNTGYNEYAKQYSWSVQFRNRYYKKLSLSTNLFATQQEARNGKTTDRVSNIRNNEQKAVIWLLVDSKDRAFVKIDGVRLGEDDWGDDYYQSDKGCISRNNSSGGNSGSNSSSSKYSNSTKNSKLAEYNALVKQGHDLVKKGNQYKSGSYYTQALEKYKTAKELASADPVFQEIKNEKQSIPGSLKELDKNIEELENYINQENAKKNAINLNNNSRSNTWNTNSSTKMNSSTSNSTSNNFGNTRNNKERSRELLTQAIGIYNDDPDKAIRLLNEAKRNDPNNKVIDSWIDSVETYKGSYMYKSSSSNSSSSNSSTFSDAEAAFIVEGIGALAQGIGSLFSSNKSSAERARIKEERRRKRENLKEVKRKKKIDLKRKNNEVESKSSSSSNGLTI